jgi:hypothetical protein
MHDPHSYDQLLAETITANAGGPIIEEEWLCDVIAANAELIALHNGERIRQGLPVEPKFNGITPEPMHLQELLMRDYTFLAQGEPSLRNPMGRYILVEIAAPYPQSEYCQVEIENNIFHLIFFRGPLLHLIHSAFSKVMMLLVQDRYDGCLEQHRPFLAGDIYSDLNLLIGFFNDIEVLFDHKRIFTPVAPPHLNNPYDYCENVEGARRFLLGHEIGHAHFHPIPETIAFAEALMVGGIEPHMAEAWSEEFWCDKFALWTMMDIYEDLYDGGQLTEARGFELHNALAGMLLLLSLMEMARIAVNRQRPLLGAHPPEDIRLAVLCQNIKHHRLYSKLDWLSDALRGSWMLLKQFRSLASFANMGLFPTKFFIALQNKQLSLFGYNAYKAISNYGVLKSTDILGWDPDALGGDDYFVF